MIRALAALLLGRRDDDTYVSHLPITAPAPDWNCYSDTPYDPDRPPERVGWGRWEAQCQNCQGMHPVSKDHKLILKHTPSLPTVEYCDCGRPYYEVDELPVYMGKIGKPTCALCAMGDATGIADDGSEVHGAQPWLDDPT